MNKSSNNSNSCYTVYIHTAPNGKKYVGITSLNPEIRWGKNGKRYNNKHFCSAIDKYGWDSFTHEIVAEGLSKEDACRLEIDLIAKYNTTNPDYGYNMTTGGDCSIPNEEVRYKLHCSTKNQWKNDDFRTYMIDTLTGHNVSDETKKKISQSKLGKSLNKPTARKGKKLSEEHRQKLCGHTPWCKGLTKETDERVKRIAEKETGKVKSQESIEKQKLSMVKVREKKGPTIWVHNDKSETLIAKSDLQKYLDSGYSKGRLNIINTYIYKDNETKKVSKSELDFYLNNGWKLGKSHQATENIAKSKQQYVWCYDNQEFTSAKNLALYLNTHGYPNIVSSTITALYNKGFDKSEIYNNLDGKITRYENKKD